MSTVQKSIRLYAWKTNYQTFRIVQGEVDSRTFNIQLFSTTIPVNLSKCSVMLYAVKPDSNVVYTECDVLDATNGLVSVTLDEQIAAVEGTVDCWIQVIGEGGTDLRFEGMNIQVGECDITRSIESSSEFKAFLQQSAKVGELEQEVKAARMGSATLADKERAQDNALAGATSTLRAEFQSEDADIREELAHGDAVLQQNIDAEKARIDQLAASPEIGEGDLEKEMGDLRVGDDGVTYGSAGTAVRERMAVRNVKAVKMTDMPEIQLPVQEVQQAIEQKGQEVLDSIPADYTALSEEVANLGSVKANLTQINRFFDNDIFYGCKNYVENVEILFNTANGTNTTQSCYLEPGVYVLQIHDTNFDRVIVTDKADGARLVDVSDVVGSHRFTLPDGSNRIIIHFYTDTSSSATDYYARGVYVFAEGKIPVIPTDFLEPEIQAARYTMEGDVPKAMHPELVSIGTFEWEYDGSTLGITPRLKTVTLSKGKYRIYITATNSLGIVVWDSNGHRILSNDAEPIFELLEDDTITVYCIISNTGVDCSPAGTVYIRGVFIVNDNDVPLLPDFLTRYNELKEIAESAKSSSSLPSIAGGYLVVKGNITANGSIFIQDSPHVKKSVSISFSGDFDTFSGLRIGQGKTSYGGGYIEITDTEIISYSHYSSLVENDRVEHGLSISDFISVNIKSGAITVLTAGGSFTASMSWKACNGNVFAESMGSALSECVLNWTASDLTSKVWVFGDSYLSMDSSRWAGQMQNLGYKNWLASGYPGGTSADELSSLTTLLSMYTPDVVVWCLGMNNGDKDSINASWLNCVQDVITKCENRGIEVVLSTIPTCPIVDNTYKNEWVKASGKRFVDFNRAVGVNGTAWYTGMLSSDNVHPTELGAKALCNRVLADVPEIMIGN